MNEKIIFYREWFPLDKKEFRIMAMLADKGSFKGNLSNMCRYFSLSPQQKNRNNLRTSIKYLNDGKWITAEKCGNTYCLKLIPKAEEIRIPRKWLTELRKHNYSSESVSWEAILKVLLWIHNNKNDIITNTDISNDLNISISTICAAKKVLKNEYEAIRVRKVSEKINEDFFMTIGQELHACAWWNID